MATRSSILALSIPWTGSQELQASLVAQRVKKSACNVEDLGSILGLGRSPGEGRWQPTAKFLAWRIP